MRGPRTWRGFATSADVINDRLLVRLRGGAARARPSGRSQELCAGAPVSVQRNDYERGLYNGDQGVVVRVASEMTEEPELMAVFQRGPKFEVFPLDVLRDLAPAFAMTVHKARRSEFDHVAIILPDVDLLPDARASLHGHDACEALRPLFGRKACSSVRCPAPSNASAGSPNA